MGLYNFVNNMLEKLIAPAQPPLILDEPITKTDLKHKTKKELEEMDANPPIQHPLVCINPDNEKKFLFINVPIFCGSIVGMEVEKSSDLLSSLYRHVQQPEFNFRLVWSEDTLVVWENTHCLHYPVSDYFPHERKMLRVAIQGHRKPCSVC